MSAIMSIIGTIWPLILAAVAGIFWLISSWRKGKIQGQQQTIEELRNANRVYKVKEDIHEYDEKVRDEAEEQINRVEDQIREQPTEEGKAQVVGGALDDYFQGKDDE